MSAVSWGACVTLERAPARLPEQQRLTSVAIIPARYQSTRLPGKPLLDLEGFR